MIYGYARTSTNAQDLATQLDQPEAARCERTFHDELSGLNIQRPQLEALLATAALGDTVIIPAIDRLSRNTAGLLTIAPDTKAASVGLRSLAEPVIQTTGAFYDIALAVLGLAAKLEHKRIRERAIGRAAGKHLGRKPNSRRCGGARLSAGVKEATRRLLPLRTNAMRQHAICSVGAYAAFFRSG